MYPMSFKDLQLIEPIQRALQTAGYQHPTPIQAQSIPHALQGRDLLACAQTGTGKTAAFALPILQLLSQADRPSKHRKPVRALILAPTRELAIQIGESIEAYGSHLPLRHLVIFGGVSQHKQVQQLQKGVDIVVATPGRLLDLVQQKLLHLDQVEWFVLDEADRMLDMGFIHDIKRVIRLLPGRRQNFFFSATLPKHILQLSESILRDPVQVTADAVSSAAERVDQKVFFVPKNRKRHLLVHLLQGKDIAEALVFTRTKHGANRVVKELNKKGIQAEAIHGNKSQNARQKALKNFKERRTRVLVATDIAARGIDIVELSHVINFDLPNISETYVHRIGRTGRAGASGLALSFCDAEERAYLSDIQKLTGQRIPAVKDHPFAGEPEAAPSPSACPERKRGPQPRNKHRKSFRKGAQARRR